MNAINKFLIVNIIRILIITRFAIKLGCNDTDYASTSTSAYVPCSKVKGLLNYIKPFQVEIVSCKNICRFNSKHIFHKKEFIAQFLALHVV